MAKGPWRRVRGVMCGDLTQRQWLTGCTQALTGPHPFPAYDVMSIPSERHDPTPRREPDKSAEHPSGIAPRL